MNQERQAAQSIEQRLRDYAGRRRKALGARLEMPMPLRQRLHGVIRASPPASDRAWLFDWQPVFHLLRQPWALGMLTVLLLGGLFIWYKGQSRQTEVALVRTGDPERLAPSPAATPAVPSPAQEPTQPPSAAVRQASDRWAGGETGRPDAVNVAVAGDQHPVSRAGTPSPTLLSASGAARATDGSAASPPAPASAGAPMSDPAVMPAVPMTKTTRTVARREVSSRASPAPPPVRVRFAQRAPAGSVPVLNSFRIEQVGQQLQIVDEDESVYAAQVLLAPELGLPVLAASPPVPAATRSAAFLESERVPQELAVTALGTNRGLQQRVALVGKLILTNRTGGPRLENQAAVLTNQAALMFLLNNSRLEGRVAIGPTSHVAILAVPSP